MSPGYLNPGYAESLVEFGNPVELPKCRGWLLERSIPGTDLRDVMGCYPLFCCEDWEKLPEDLHDISGRYVTVTVVPDPFLPMTATDLAKCFDQVIPFKQHHVISLRDYNDNSPDRHHRYYARKSLEKMSVRRVERPGDFLEDWVRLYAELVSRHQLSGIKAFSRDCFARQLSLPGLRMFVAEITGRVVAAQLWFVQGEVAYSHLTAISQEGYSNRASYGLYWGAIGSLRNEFDSKLRWLDLGAGAGIDSKNGDGLAKFKEGWANATRTKFLCTRVFDSEAYARLIRLTGSENTTYFPAYRLGEA